MAATRWLSCHCLLCAGGSMAPWAIRAFSRKQPLRQGASAITSSSRSAANTTPVLTPEVIQADRSTMQLFKVHVRGQMCAGMVSMVSKLLLTELTVKISSKGTPAGGCTTASRHPYDCALRSQDRIPCTVTIHMDLSPA
jgi:hypothetical protein